MMTQDKPDVDKLLKVTDVAEMLDVHKDTVLEWLRTAALPGFKLPGGAWRIRERDFIAWMEQLQAESQQHAESQRLAARLARQAARLASESKPAKQPKQEN